MFNTDRLIIVHYSQGCGGKFLINCLALADNAVLQHRHLAKMQLDGHLSTAEKIKTITQKLSATQNKWYDLGWGCQEYFGFDSDTYLTQPVSQLPFDPIVEQVIEAGKYFFLVSHDPVFLNKAIAVWPNAKIVIIDHCNEFIACKRDITQTINRLKNYWDKIRGDSWPVDPPFTIESMENLPEFVLEEVQKTHNNELAAYVYSIDYQTGVEQICAKLKNTVLHWNALWTLGTDSMIQNVEMLANDLGLDPVAPQYIEQYHREYMTTLDRIKNNGNN